MLTINYNGNAVAEAFYQPEPFFASDDVNVLYTQFTMDSAIGLFVCAVIRQEKYRFSYGRKWNLERMRESLISLPQGASGMPDWPLMQRYIISLRYSGVLADDGIVVSKHAMQEG